MLDRSLRTYFFALVVVRRGDRFLLVDERRGGWYLPAGRVEPGEGLVAAAVRETMEETGVPVRVDGVVRVEHSPTPDGTVRVRVIFTAQPVDDTPPKSHADEHSRGAAWFGLAELEQLRLRGAEVRTILGHVAGGGAVYPLGVLAHEGDPFGA